MELIVIRHARPQHVVDAAGAADPDLSEIGREQAERTADLLVGAGVDHLVTSPMRRAMQTAAPLAARLDLEPQTVDGLAEYDRHESSYIPAEVQRETDPESFYVDPLEHLGDDVQRFASGVVAGFEGVIAAHPGRRVAVFCHGMVTSVWFAHVLGLVGGRTQFVPDYCGVSRFLASSGGVVTVRSFNEVAHLGDTFIPLFE